MVKAAEITVDKNKINIDKIIAKARESYGKNLAMVNQISSGNSLSRPNKDSDFIVSSHPFWLQLTGIRGIQFGRVTQLSGYPDSGKSSICMFFMREAINQGHMVILLDTEGKFSAHRFDKFFGGKSDQLIISTSRMILEGIDQVEKIVHAAMEIDPSKKILICWDSCSGSLAKNENTDSLLEGKAMASHAKENGIAIKAILRLCEQYKDKEKNDEKIALLLVNQTYANISLSGHGAQKEAGGIKIYYYSSLIVQLTRIKDLVKVSKGVKIKTGVVVKAKIKKNHLADREESIAELELVVTAGSVALLNEKKVKEKKNESWDDDDDELEEESDE